MSKTTDYQVQWTPELREAVDNRIIEYLLQGYSQQEAEEKALLDLLDHTTFILPEVTVIAQAPVQKQVAVESDWDPRYTKFMSGERYYADQDHKNYLDWLRNDYTRGIREATDKWGNAIGAGVEIASGFTPLWWAAPAVRTGLNLSEGNYKGAALNAGLAFAAPYAVGKAFLYGDDLYRGYKSMTDPKNVYAAMAEGMTPVKTSSAGMWTNRGTRSAKISEAERLGIPKGVRNNKNIVREVPDSQLDDKIWVLKDGTYLEGTFRDIKPGQLFKYDPQDAVSYTYMNGPDKNPLNPDRYLLSDGEFLGLDYMSEYGGNSFLRKDSHIYNHIKMLSNSLLHDKLKAIATDIQMPRELYALFLNPRYIQSFKQYYLNKGWRVGNLTDEEIAKIIAYNHKLLTSNLTGVAKDVILWNGSGKQTTADGAVVREAAPDNFKIITENLQGGGGDIRGVWFSDFKDALSYGYPKQIGGSRQHTWEGVLLVDILPYLINDARGHMSAGYKFGGHTAPKNLILHSRELVSGDLDNIKGLFPHPELILLEGNGFTRSWSTKGLHYKKGGTIHIKKKNRGKFTDYCGGKVTEECIRKGKNSSNPTTRKRANFAWVARHKFKHEEGGKLNYLNYFN